MPRVSVVIPACNVADRIEQALHCVSRQTWRDFEVLVVDDGSTDGTAALAAAVPDRRIRVLRQAHHGAAGARNAGIRAARGEFIAFLEPGDLWHAEKLARHVAHLEARAEVGVSYSQSAFIDDGGRPLGYLQTPQLRGVRAHDVFLRNPVGNGSAPVIRRCTLEQIATPARGGAPGETWYFDEDMHQSEDIECWMRIALTTRWRFEGLGLPLTQYRVGAGGLLAALDRQLASWEQVVERLNGYAPFFARRWAPVARGFQLRYLARRALRAGQTVRAWQLLAQALRQHPGMLVSEAPRTLSTLAAAVLQAALPARTYARAEAVTMRWAARWSPRVRAS